MVHFLSNVDTAVLSSNLLDTLALVQTGLCRFLLYSDCISLRYVVCNVFLLYLRGELDHKKM